MTTRGDVVVFLGPSLPRAQARKVLDADYRPPARQGDVFAALRERPRAIVLIDGVFESVPSVWHHELVAASAAGVALYGASSMGALRAAELPGLVRPVGEIARRFASGAWNDDAAVALLHGEAPRFSALTVPWVNVWATARGAQRRGVLTAGQARGLCATAEALFYQDRTWPAVLAALRWPAKRAARLRAFVARGGVDLKAADARACLRLVARTRFGPRPAPVGARLSSAVRRSRLPPGAAPGEGGVRTLLLAEFARVAGITPPAGLVALMRRRLADGPAAEDELERWAEALALEVLVLQAPERFVADGPSLAEGSALAAAVARGSPLR